jgi:hypothetical protein
MNNDPDGMQPDLESTGPNWHGLQEGFVGAVGKLVLHLLAASNSPKGLFGIFSLFPHMPLYEASGVPEDDRATTQQLSTTKPGTEYVLPPEWQVREILNQIPPENWINDSGIE